MTDEESRKAFVKWQNGERLSRQSEPWFAWQASAEYHTKRERERCAALCRLVGQERQLMCVPPIYATERWVIAEECAQMIEQEPKP